MDCYHCILVERDFTFGKLLLKPLDRLVALDATGDGSTWHIRQCHGLNSQIDTVDWAELEELEATGNISFDR